MSDKNETSAATESKTEDKGKNAHGVVDYLQAPRRKRKNFIVIAAGPNGDQETTAAIARYVKSAFPKCAIATPQNPEEFVRQFSRNIVLTVIDDQFVELGETLDLIKQMKEKKSDAAIPVLFLTRDPNSLIQAYSEKLAAWHEIDEYVVPATTPRPYLFAKVKSGMEDHYRRRSRRYKINFPVTFTVLNEGEKKFQGAILDMSIHGALLKSSDNYIFTPRDQILVHMPYGTYVKGAQFDILRVAAKIKRIFIAGDRAGISWEHVNDFKVEQLSRMLLSIVDTLLIKQASATRAKIVKADADAAASNPRGVPTQE